MHVAWIWKNPNILKLEGSIVMPPKRMSEPRETSECMLRIGKYNNVIAWNMQMRSIVGEL